MGWEGTNPADWVEKAKRQIDAVRKEAAQSLAKELTTTIPRGGRVPVDTGNLARSLLAQTGAMPAQKETPEGGFPAQDIGPALLNWKPGETLYLGYQAKYAARMNYGFVGTDSLGREYNQSGFGFLEAAVAKWPEFVSAAAAKVREKTGG